MILMNPSIENKGNCLPVHLPFTGMLKLSFINKYAKWLCFVPDILKYVKIRGGLTLVPIKN